MLCLASLPDCINALAGDTTVAETFVSDFKGEQGPAWRAHRYGVKAGCAMGGEIGGKIGGKKTVASNAAFAAASTTASCIGYRTSKGRTTQTSRLPQETLTRPADARLLVYRAL